jgi:hypothetical protein
VSRGRVGAAPEAPVVFGSPPGPGLFNGLLMVAPRGRARGTTTLATGGRQGRSGAGEPRSWGSVSRNLNALRLLGSDAFANLRVLARGSCA